MGKRSVFGLIFIILLSLLITACSGKTSTDAVNDEESDEPENIADDEKEVMVIGDEPDSFGEKYEVSLEGEYAGNIKDLEIPMNEDDWYPADYTEEENSAVAEFVKNEETLEDYTELVTIHYYTGENELMSIENFILSMEEAAAEMISGNVAFKSMDITEEEGFYQFTITDDDTELDQEEIGMVFIKEGGLYVVRYTVMEQEMEEEEQEAWLETIQQIQ